MIITIDGPTASGKSTVARELAKKLGSTYINSGLLFRAIAYLFEVDRPSPYEGSMTEFITRSLSTHGDLQYRYTQEHGVQIFYQNKDITPLLKTPEIDRLASQIALNSEVRDCIRIYQQDLAKYQSVIAEGRDCGTVIFPHADCKLYITARLEVRAKRWQRDQEKKGTAYSLEESKRLIEERDTRDSERALAPLVIPPGATVIDTSSMSISEVVEACLKICKNKVC